MSQRLDVQKQRQWEERFGRYRSGGMTVARFCAKERVSPHAFYYWARRVGSQRVRPGSAQAGQTPEVMPHLTRHSHQRNRISRIDQRSSWRFMCERFVRNRTTSMKSEHADCRINSSNVTHAENRPIDETSSPGDATRQDTPQPFLAFLRMDRYPERHFHRHTHSGSNTTSQ